MKILIIEARFYETIADELLKGAQLEAHKAGAQCDVVSVPGALEIPIALAIALEKRHKGTMRFDAAIALGCVIRGETSHYDIVAVQSARALMDMACAERLPFGNAILTVETSDQALVRARVEEGNKGAHAVRSALQLLAFHREARSES